MKPEDIRVGDIVIISSSDFRNPTLSKEISVQVLYKDPDAGEAEDILIEAPCLTSGVSFKITESFFHHISIWIGQLLVKLDIGCFMIKSSENNQPLLKVIESSLDLMECIV